LTPVGGAPSEGAAARAAAAAQVFVGDPADPEVSPDDRHHLLRVLRLRAGETVVASDGRGHWCRCRLRDPGGATPSGGTGEGTSRLLEPDGPVLTEEAPAPALTVAFAPVKGDRPEWVVQKLTELGVDRIVPLLAARSVIRWDGDRSERAVEKLRRAAREAAAQCRRVWLPEVTGVRPVADLVRSEDRMALAQLGGEPPGAGTTVLAVGPEGGWSPEELALGLPTVGLGPWVLRAETAAVAAGSIMAALRAGTVVGREVGAGCPRPDVGELT
jgi:16S rRNA (uracil1498-N3)-methyltransferase